jgi:superfamily II DNA or RNA helicase
MPQLGAEHDIALGALEREEYRSLAWGYVDGSLSERAADEIVAKALAASGSQAQPDAVLDQLVESKLVRRWRAPEPRYRTRFAELLRLLVRSRQLFYGRPWRSAPTLVSNFRVDIRERATPRADIPPVEALQGIGALTKLSPLQESLWRALMLSDTARLRRFQVDAARRLLVLPPEHGTIVTAGTGSGKTLAFYLPAMVAVGERLRRGDHWTRALCLYPRQELLKDQVTEAYRMLVRAAGVLLRVSRAPVLGALYGGTPRRAHRRELENVGWKQVNGGYVCPFLRCPKCGLEMVWRDADVDAARERLFCVSPECNTVTVEETIRLTRSSISKTPPDFLFTTTEMLNQRLSDLWTRHVFGIGQHVDKRPLFILLDEIHTYSGTSGAQVALLLRRWRTLVDAPVKWAGLSATLREAEQFFADLTGLRPDQIAEVTPRIADLERWGADYQILLQTDPSSQAATLSTSIQGAMLIARMLDPVPNGPSNGRVGRRLFAFTDELDVTHRLYDDLRDAEAYDFFGRPNRDKKPLAQLRADNAPDGDAREVDGQRWAIAEALRGGTLESRLVVGRTTSRDPGVDSKADVIVATAALEVGFNDPDVGAVLQHKSPRSFAAYLQRRGRAGRRAGMRPISVTVLSDYGRDRIAFQSYERLFDPVVERQILPVRNTYVLKMQAVYALMDWLALKVGARGVRGWSWDALSRPTEELSDTAKDFQKEAGKLILELVKLDESTVQGLSRHLRSALRLSEEEVRTILWEQPRSLLLEAVPTLHRRIVRDWSLANGQGFDRFVSHHPLPDFAPRNLFDDLNLPEVIIEVPAATTRHSEKYEAMPILQALNQFAPGRVRRRFADERGGLAHWFPVDIAAPDAIIPITSYAVEFEHLGYQLGRHGGEDIQISIYRPSRLRLQQTPRNISQTSNAVWHWQSRFELVGSPLQVDLPPNVSWFKTISQLDFFLHRFSAAVSQLRFSGEGTADIRSNREAVNVRYRLIEATEENEVEKPAAIGFEAETDALCVSLRVPASDSLSSADMPADLQHWLRYLHFRSTVAEDILLPANANSFQRDWLAQIYLLTALQRAESKQKTLLQAIDEIVDGRALRQASAALVVGAILDDEDGESAESKLEQTLAEISAIPNVVAQMGSLLKASLTLSGSDWGAWLASLVQNTLAEAVLQACLLAAPANTALSGITTDLLFQNGNVTAVVSETTLGGGGTIEALAQAFSVEPRLFGRSLDAALAPSEQEETAVLLERFLRLALNEPEVGRALEELRAANSADEREAARQALLTQLARRSVPPTHGLQVSIATRLLRPGASPVSDTLTVSLLDRWQGIEARHGIAMPVRIAAALCAGMADLRDELVSMGGQPGSEVGTASLLLWPRGGEIRSAALQSYNPFRRVALTDSMLARSLLVDGRLPIVRFGEERWKQRLDQALAAGGQVRLIATSREREVLRQAAVQLLAEPIEMNYLRLYPVIEGWRELADGSPALDLSVRERT